MLSARPPRRPAVDAPELLEGHGVHRRPVAGTGALGASPSAPSGFFNNTPAAFLESRYRIHDALNITVVSTK